MAAHPDVILAALAPHPDARLDVAHALARLDQASPAPLPPPTPPAARAVLDAVATEVEL